MRIKCKPGRKGIAAPWDPPLSLRRIFGALFGGTGAGDSLALARGAGGSLYQGWKHEIADSHQNLSLEKGGLYGDLCYELYLIYEYEIQKGEAGFNQDNLRIRRMLDYIHAHFSDHIGLSQIAGIADIGERECLRCFQRTIQLSPMQYLLKYRMMQGAKLLEMGSSQSVSEIASLCGFDSPSNFSRMFKRFYNYTPREYRNANLRHAAQEVHSER